MSLRTALLGALLLAPMPAVSAAPDDSVTGLWLTDDRKGVVRIAACGQQVCGYISQVLDRAPDVPTTDVNNPDPKLRKRPLVGLRTLWGFSRKGNSWEGGRAYDPKSGKSYRSTLQLNADGSLKVSGCVLIICDSRRWTRYR